ncbi:hypothetical protein H7Y63_00500 [Polaromonas sp.]|nr:hypothetical protein [Candidatus Saccharibacteria bacterium]
MSDNATSQNNKLRLRTGAFILIGVLLAVAGVLSVVHRRAEPVAKSEAKVAKTVNLDSVFASAKAELVRAYPGATIKDSTDTSSAWSIAGIAPGYNFSTSVDLGKYHLSLQPPSENATVPGTAHKMLTDMIISSGGKRIDSPVPTTYPSKTGQSSYYKFTNGACYLDYKPDKSALNVDCAKNSDFAKVASSVKPFVILYQAANKSSIDGNDYAVHMPYTGQTAQGTAEYAALPLDGTVGYFYKPQADGWKYFEKSVTGLLCSELTSTPKEAFASICKS